MAEDKLKLEPEIELVEDLPEKEQAQLQPVCDSLEKKGQAGGEESLPAPQAVLENKVWLMARFTLICGMIGFIPFMLAPGFLLPAFNHPAVRTVAVAVLIWNLIGAALYANVKTSSHRNILYLIFGVPLMTFGLWWFHAVMLFHTLGILQ